MKLRIEVNKLVLNSGIFKVNNVREFPEGVFRLQPDKRISAKTLPDIDLRYFINALEEILQKYFNSPLPESLEKATAAEIEKIKKGITKLLLDYFTEDKIKLYSKKITGSRKFKNEIAGKLKSTGAFENKKADRRYYHLVVPLFQEIQNYLKTHETDTYYYICHFLIGCGIEKGSIETVFERIRKFVARYEINPKSSIATYRKDPRSIIDLP